MKKETKKDKPEVKAESTEVNTQTVEQALTEENEKLIAEVERLTAENEKLTKTCNRLQSSADKSDTYLGQLVAMKNDFESYKRRMKFNGEQAKAEGVQSVIVKLIAVIDNFELAKQHLTDENLKAFQMVYDKFLQILKECGVEEMDVIGQPFDCMRMNALSKIDYGEDKRDLVVEVYKKGYVMGDKVLRYAEVIVGA